MSQMRNSSERTRLSVDLEAHQDVKHMLLRYEKERQGVSRTTLVVEMLRKDLIARGFARKKDVAA